MTRHCIVLILGCGLLFAKDDNKAYDNATKGANTVLMHDWPASCVVSIVPKSDYHCYGPDINHVICSGTVHMTFKPNCDTVSVHKATNKDQEQSKDKP